MQAGASAFATSHLHRLMATSQWPVSAPAAGARVSSCTQPRQKMPGAPEADEAGEKPGEKEEQAISAVLPPSAPPRTGRLVRKVGPTRGEGRPPARTGQSQVGPVTDRLAALPASLVPRTARRKGGSNRACERSFGWRLRDSMSGYHDSSSLYRRRHGIDCECVAGPVCQM
jgi:hypothetical protein